MDSAGIIDAIFYVVKLVFEVLSDTVKIFISILKEVIGEMRKWWKK